MAKATSTKDAYQEMLDLLSPEERATLLEMTGQSNSGGGNKTPVVKINFNRVDENGKKIAKGNFVIGQKSGIGKDGKEAVLEIGTDLGSELNAVVLKFGTQYSYYSQDAKKRCSSQIITERGEVPTGSNLKLTCNDKSCPRRKEGVDKAEKCACQYVVFLRLPAGVKLPDGTDAPVAMMYLKGTQFKPFQDYINNDLKGIPTIAVNTKFTATEEGNAVTYYQMHFEKGDAVPAAVFKENFALVSGVNQQLLAFKEENKNKMLAEKPSTPVAGAGEGVNAKQVPADDEIPW